MTRRELLVALRDGVRLRPDEAETLDILLACLPAGVLDAPVNAPPRTHPWQRYSHDDVLRARASTRRRA